MLLHLGVGIGDACCAHSVYYLAFQTSSTACVGS